MLKLKQEFKISHLFLRGSVGLEGKINNEKMISPTPTVHKLDKVSSWCLADCSKYVRESQWRSVWKRVNVVSHVGCSFLLLGREERECVLCHVDRSVLLEKPAWQSREKMVCPAANQKGSEGRMSLSCWLALSCCWPVGKQEGRARNG